MPRPFAHLHLHTQFSLLDGAIKHKALFARAKALGMPAVAMTDHGNLFGAVEFHEKARDAGVKPILGCETYVAAGSRFDKEVRMALGPRTWDGKEERQILGFTLVLPKGTSVGGLASFQHKAFVNDLILAKLKPDARTIVLTGYGNIATAVSAVKLGAVDYLAKPADADDVTDALLAPHNAKAPPPENPMSADRVRWEHIQRVYELCNRNVSETARRLNMHRRTLQRILGKHAPKEQ